LAWLITKWYAKSDQLSLTSLGISFNRKNCFEFLYGFLIGVLLWGGVSICQSFFAGFSWELRPDVGYFNLIYGLVFIFIADLGTELFTRGYPLTILKNKFGAHTAIAIIAFCTGLNSFFVDAQGELLLYAVLIPVLHIVFFSFIYLKTKRLGASLGVHTGANFITISIFDLRPGQANQAIPSGMFQSNVELDSLSLTALQLPWVVMASLFSIAVYIWWRRKPTTIKE